MPHAGGQSPSLDPHKSICHGQQPPPGHSSPSTCPSQHHLRSSWPGGFSPHPPPLHPPIQPPPPTTCWRSALGPASRAPPMLTDQTASLTSPHQGVLPRAPSEPGALASRTPDAEPTPLALAHPGAGAPFLPRVSSTPPHPPAPAGAPITPTAPAPGSPPHRPAPAPGVAPPSSRHTQQPLALASCLGPGRGSGLPVASSPPPQPVVLSSGPQSWPHPPRRKPSAVEAPRLAISPTPAASGAS